MAKKLTHNLSSQYIEAATRLRPHGTKRKIIAYVESYSDILFWSNLLQDMADDTCDFEVMLPSRNSLSKGKKVAMMNELGRGLGSCMIACVDADYDYLMQQTTPVSRMVNKNPYIFHTYAYAIENFQCYAPALHTVCVMATLNDQRIFDYKAFLTEFSVIVFPLFVWNIWCYRHHKQRYLDLPAFADTIALEHISIKNPEKTLAIIRGKVNRKIAQLQHKLPEAKADYKQLIQELNDLGVVPERTYLFIRGHDLLDNIVAPLLNVITERLKKDRENEIRKLAKHEVQLQNELAAYRHATEDIMVMLTRHTEYRRAALYKRIQQDIAQLVQHLPSKEEEASSQKDDSEDNLS